MQLNMDVHRFNYPLYSEPNPNEKLDLLPYKAISRSKIIFAENIVRVAFSESGISVQK